jgi:hypothetical protein
VLLLSILLAGAAGTARAQSNDDEYRVKAAFLFHLAQLVDWPGSKPLIERPQGAKLPDAVKAGDIVQPRPPTHR